MLALVLIMAGFLLLMLGLALQIAFVVALFWFVFCLLLLLRLGWQGQATENGLASSFCFFGVEWAPGLCSPWVNRCDAQIAICFFVFWGAARHG